MQRRWAGSWLSGPAAAADAQKYPGQRLGLPEEGPRSVAGVGRRFGALFIDWVLCMVIALAAFKSQAWTIAVFAVEVYLLTALTGFTVGKRLLGIRVARLDGGSVCCGRGCGGCCCSQSPRRWCSTVICAGCTTRQPTRS